MIALSKREQEVVKLVALGHRKKTVASALNVSIKTIEKHVTKAYEKIGVHNSILLTHYCLSRQWITNHYERNENPPL